MKKLLALLLLRANQVVGLDSFVEELWGDNPPQTAVTTTQTYVYHLRKLITEAKVKTAAPGYVLEADEGDVDANRFDSLMARAQLSAAAGDHRATAGHAKEALALWRGTPLAGVDCGNVLRGYAVNLEERHIAALELRVRAEMQLGNYREMIADLRSLVAVHPLNEWFHAQLITALHRVGRRSEALRAYQTVRELLRRELGLEPSQELWQLHQEILASDMRSRATRGRAPMVAGGLIRPASAL
ncbi:AfsR/SARP family transcriptional regulator [Actinacidiphila yanglinensis]|uniref:AfsR/SARP family transcriptional regulator n=1 Tax=Actinacidiphila yanglinensis TaxID=310779 RepID=UPI0013595536|nr:AfsR/SARP family transcriptional regulator [Actinacidiphila yanglinensis]